MVGCCYFAIILFIIIPFHFRHVCNPQSVLESMLRTKTNVMPGHVLSAYVQNIAKLYSLLLLKAEAEQDWDVIESLDNLMLSKLPQFELCDHLETQERVCLFRFSRFLHRKLILLRILHAVYDLSKFCRYLFFTLRLVLCWRYCA